MALTMKLSLLMFFMAAYALQVRAGGPQPLEYASYKTNLTKTLVDMKKACDKWERLMDLPFDKGYLDENGTEVAENKVEVVAAVNETKVESKSLGEIFRTYFGGRKNLTNAKSAAKDALKSVNLWSKNINATHVDDALLIRKFAKKATEAARWAKLAYQFIEERAKQRGDSSEYKKNLSEMKKLLEEVMAATKNATDVSEGASGKFYDYWKKKLEDHVSGKITTLPMMSRLKIVIEMMDEPPKGKDADNHKVVMKNLKTITIRRFKEMEGEITTNICDEWNDPEGVRKSFKVPSFEGNNVVISSGKLCYQATMSWGPNIVQITRTAPNPDDGIVVTGSLTGFCDRRNATVTENGIKPVKG